MTSAFIIQVQPELQSDPNEETAALLRVLIHKIDNTTFGNDVPALPQWTGPSHTVIQVQAILYASLAASLFSAFLAMLGKQWLNRYASIDMRGSAIERSQNRQRKLDGIVTWYFDYVMESLPLMLQFALLLLGCALCRYLWEINTTVASVVLGVTSFGVASYGFFVVAGAASSSCPYQTPGTHILRLILPLALSALQSTSSYTLNALRTAFFRSAIVEMFFKWCVDAMDIKCSIGYFANLTLVPLLWLIVCPIVDVYRLARVAVRALVAYTLRARGLCRRVRGWSRRARGWFRRVCGWDPQSATLDLRCILWMLQTSLDRTIHLSTLRLLATMMTPVSSDPALLSTCFDILAGCVSIIDGKVVVLQGSEELATVSSLFCLRTLCHLITMDPASSVSKDVRRWYTKAFPMETNFKGLPFYHHFSIIHNIFYPSFKYVRHRHYPSENFKRPKIQWRGYELSTTDHAVLMQLTQFEYQRKQPHKVPRWILRYGFHLLTQDPPSPTSVVADCLSIIAMDLGCVVSTATTPDKRYAHT